MAPEETMSKRAYDVAKKKLDEQMEGLQEEIAKAQCTLLGLREAEARLRTIRAAVLVSLENAGHGPLHPPGENDE
jgi:septation ring formation regulator EzrA